MHGMLAEMDRIAMNSIMFDKTGATGGAAVAMACGGVFGRGGEIGARHDDETRVSPVAAGCVGRG